MVGFHDFLYPACNFRILFFFLWCLLEVCNFLLFMVMLVPISVYYGCSFCCDIPHLQVSLEGQISRQSVKQSLSNGHIPSGDQIPWKFCEQYQDTVFPSLSGARIVRIATHPDDMKVTSIFWLMVLVYHILQKFQHLFSFLNLSLISAWIWFASS